MSPEDRARLEALEREVARLRALLEPQGQAKEASHQAAPPPPPAPRRVRLSGLEAYMAAGILGILPDAAGQVSEEEGQAVGALLTEYRARGYRWPAVATPPLEVQARRLALLARALGEHVAALRRAVSHRGDLPHHVREGVVGALQEALEALEGN